MGRFKKGFFMGSLIGAGLVWMTTTKKGREVRQQLLDHSGNVYEQVKQKAAESELWDKMTKQKYVALVREAVDKYAVQTGMSSHVKELVMKVVGKQWKTLQREMKKRT